VILVPVDTIRRKNGILSLIRDQRTKKAGKGKAKKLRNKGGPLYRTYKYTSGHLITKSVYIRKLDRIRN